MRKLAAAGLIAVLCGVAFSAAADARRATRAEAVAMLRGAAPRAAVSCIAQAKVSDARPRYGVIAIEAGRHCVPAWINGAFFVMKRTGQRWRRLVDGTQGIRCSNRKIPRDLLGRLVNCYGPR